jgi:transposase-like protein
MTRQITLEQLQEFNDGLKDVQSMDDLIGKDGLITGLFKNTLQAMLEGELTNQLGYPRGEGSRILKNTSNKRNGKTTKNIRSSMGDMTIDIPRDRDGDFEPHILPKYQKSTNEIERKIISMYGKGMTVSDLNNHLADMYGVSVTDAMISEITNKIIPELKEWQNRPLEPTYVIIYIDALHYKVRVDGRIKNCAVYIVLGLTIDGHKEILGIWVGEEEGAKFWLSVLTDIQSRGVEDILILCCDNLKGLSEAIKSIYPKIIIQKCVIHQIRNSLKFIASKDQKEFMKDLKTVYQASTKEQAEINLLSIEEKWGNKYPIVFRSWHTNWEELTEYFLFSPPIRKMIYTTNAIEGLNRQFRKVSKNRSVFPSQMSLQKLLYLAMKDITKKWTKPRANWSQTISQLQIHFPDRLTINF